MEFPSAKNYDVWDAKKTTVGRNKNPEACFHPMVILRNYMNKLSGAKYLFPNFKKGKNGNIKFLNEKVSYDNMLKCLREGLDSIKLADSQKYSLHSLRQQSCVQRNHSASCSVEVARNGAVLRGTQPWKEAWSFSSPGLVQNVRLFIYWFDLILVLQTPALTRFVSECFGHAPGDLDCYLVTLRGWFNCVN